MALPTQPFRDEHAALLDHVEHSRQVAGTLEHASLDERRTMLERILAFLRETLLPHARAEEEVLYPEWSRLDALISVHFRKEEEIQLPAFDAHPEVAARVLAHMGAHEHHQH